MTPVRRLALVITLSALAAGHLPAQEPAWDPISNAGIVRASGQVDSVFIDRLVPEHYVKGGDWVSYLAARLGAVPIPEPSGIRVTVDSTRILVRGRMVDLPEETRSLFGPLQMFADSTTTLEAEVVMAPTGPGVVRFVLTVIRVNGFAIPETFLQPFLARVGRQYPVLTKTGRELLVAVPEDGRVRLSGRGVHRWIEPVTAAAPPRRR